MIDIKYKRIHIEGFRSIIKPLTFELDRVGLNMIKGTNGVGKSTIFNALLWCEYGVNLKKSIEPWTELRDKTYQGVRVMVERTIGDKDYLICRHLNYKGNTLGLKGESKLLIYIKSVDEPEFEDKHLIDAKYKEDQQQEIINQLGLDDKTFLQSILFGQKMAGLVESSAKDTRSLLDNLFDVTFVAQAHEKAKNRRDELQMDIAAKNKDIELYKREIESNEKTLQDLEANRDSFDKVKADKLQTIEARIKRVEEEAKRSFEELEEAKKSLESMEEPNPDAAQLYKELREELSDKTDDVLDAERKIKSCSMSITNSEKLIKDLEEDIKNVELNCPTCGAELAKDKVNEVISNLKAKIKAGEEVLKTLLKNKEDHTEYLKKVEAELEEVNVRYEAARISYDNYHDNLSKYKSIKDTIRYTEKRLGELKADRELYTTELNETQKEEFNNEAVEKVQEKIKSLKKSLKGAETQLDNFQKLEANTNWWVKKGFGASGLKSFVFNAMLTRLNEIAQKYAEKLGFGVEFTIDMTKESKPFKMLVYKGSEVKDYEDLSGGQQQRVIVCIAFAMHELITSSKSRINLLIMDETITYMDNAGIEAFFSLISDIAETKSVYLITHLELINPVNTKTITLALKDGSTIIED